MAVLLTGGACFATGLAVFAGIISGLGLGLTGSGLEMTPAIGIITGTTTVAGCIAGESRLVKSTRVQLPYRGLIFKIFEGNERIR